MITTSTFLKGSIELDPLYPSSDGNPMAENTEQYEWIVRVAENLKRILAGQNVFVAADLLWYPVEAHQVPAGEPRSQAPDVMVIFGRPPGFRMSYKQWEEENIAPQVVFEILSQSNKTAQGKAKLREKFKFYERYGVEEYYVYDPLAFKLEVWVRQGEVLQPVPQTALRSWVSPRLGVLMEWQPGQVLKLYDPQGQSFMTFTELGERWEASEIEVGRERLKAAEAEALARQEHDRAIQAETLAQQEHDRAAQAEALAQQERDRAAQAETLAQQERDRAAQAETLAQQERDRAAQAETLAQQERDRAAQAEARLQALEAQLRRLQEET
jgi:Uma2 family endonuclease